MKLKITYEDTALGLSSAIREIITVLKDKKLEEFEVLVFCLMPNDYDPAVQTRTVVITTPEEK